MSVRIAVFDIPATIKFDPVEGEMNRALDTLGVGSLLPPILFGAVMGAALVIGLYDDNSVSQ
ncbi:hypothetical protein NKH86_23070 [Mesorhizobium sp. M0913]|uniref:hypothetical protein n=1 Tax=Mesorhizobium sp. M0913 TaxID=2957026 RepID=UPI00333ADDCD